MKPIKIGKFEISETSPCFIIAELSANHGGSLEDAIKLVHEAAKAGANAIKLQTYTADTMTIDCDKEDFLINSGTAWDGKTLYELYKEAYTPWEWHKELQGEAEKLGMEFFSTPFDETAVDFLERLNVPCHKIASFENNDIPLIKKVAKTGKPIIISTGIAKFEDIKLAIDTIKGEGNEQIILLKCTSGYPAPYNEMNLKTIESFKNNFEVIPGLSDHTLGIEVSIASIAIGAKVIEKHFCLSRNIPTADSHFSLEPGEFKQLIKSIRNVEKAIGKSSYSIGDKEGKNKIFKRSIYVVKNVNKGEILTKENIRIIRPGFGLSPKFYNNILGKKSKKNISTGTRLGENLIDNFKILKINIVCDNIDSWIYNYVNDLKYSILNSFTSDIKIIESLDIIEEGSDISFFLSCEKIVKQETIKKSKNNIVVHESDLPKGKGMSPMTWQILEGKIIVPISLIELNNKIDSGDIYYKDIIKLDGTELIGDVRKKQFKTTKKLIFEYLKNYPDFYKKV